MEYNTMEANIDMYNSLSRPPKTALKPIVGGRLKGMTDINPQWRYKIMTEKFGLVGTGWKYEVKNLWTETGANNEKLVFAQISLFVKINKDWSEPIVGIGGSRLVTTEKGTLVSNDEGYKMAVTDALGTAMKLLGVAASIYEDLWDGSKYKDEAPNKQNAPKAPAFEPKGGESTEAEKARIKELCSAKYANGSPVFTREEMTQFSQSRKERTAAELIAFIESALRNRRADAPELQDIQQGAIF